MPKVCAARRILEHAVFQPQPGKARVRPLHYCGQKISELYWHLPLTGICLGLCLLRGMEMERVAKLFKNGRNQAVRLPVEFEFDTDRVYIRRDREGNVILSKYPAKPDSWAPLLQMIEKTQVPHDFLADDERQQGSATRDPFAGEE